MCPFVIWQDKSELSCLKKRKKSAHCELGAFDKGLSNEFKAVKPAKLNSLKI